MLVASATSEDARHHKAAVVAELIVSVCPAEQEPFLKLYFEIFNFFFQKIPCIFLRKLGFYDLTKKMAAEAKICRPVAT